MRFRFCPDRDIFNVFLQDIHTTKAFSTLYLVNLGSDGTGPVAFCRCWRCGRSVGRLRWLHVFRARKSCLTVVLSPSVGFVLHSSGIVAIAIIDFFTDSAMVRMLRAPALHMKWTDVHGEITVFLPFWPKGHNFQKELFAFADRARAACVW